MFSAETEGWPRNARLTVPDETFAFRATSRIVEVGMETRFIEGSFAITGHARKVAWQRNHQRIKDFCPLYSHGELLQMIVQ